MGNLLIAQALLKTWLAEKKVDKNIAPLEYWLRFQYDERYAKLCHRVGIEPVPFVKWLKRPVSSI